jgi:glycosyltransferase involved in cell wall biosynthesis
VVALPFTYGLSFKSGSLLAALSHERAVVGTRPPVADPRFKSGEHFLAASPRDAESLAEAIIALLGDASERARIARCGLRVGQPFNWPAIAQQHLDLYAQLR